MARARPAPSVRSPFALAPESAAVAAAMEPAAAATMEPAPMETAAVEAPSGRGRFSCGEKGSHEGQRGQARYGRFD